MSIHDFASMEREGVYGLSSERLLLLDASPLSPQCCLMTLQFGTLVLTGQHVSADNLSSHVTMVYPRVLSLSILCKSTDGLFKRIPVFPDDKDGGNAIKASTNADMTGFDDDNEAAELTLFPIPDPPMEVSTVMKVMCGLRNLLEDNTQAECRKLEQHLLDSGHDPIRPLQIFLEISEQILHSLMVAMRNSANWPQKNTVAITKQLNGNAALFRKLDLNKLHSSHQIVSKASENQNQITLKYEDSAGRGHELLVTFSPCHSMILHCQVDLPKSALEEFPVAVHTIRCEYEHREHTRNGDVIGNMYNFRRPSSSEKTSSPSPFATTLSMLSKRPNNGKPPATNSTETELSNCYETFKNVIVKLQDLWDELELLDRNCCIMEPLLSQGAPTPRCLRHRIIQVTKSVRMFFSLDVYHPRKPLVDYHFISNTDEDAVSLYENRFRKKLEASEWNDDVSVRDNLERCLGFSLPGPCSVAKPDRECEHQNDRILDVEEISNGKECGVCYTVELTGGEIPGSQDQTEMPSISCENQTCGRIYHESCLQEWLESLSSSRITFDIIIGECPYCNEPISAPMRGV